MLTKSNEKYLQLLARHRQMYQSSGNKSEDWHTLTKTLNSQFISCLVIAITKIDRACGFGSSA
jgi:hypothetical protein